MIQLKAYIKIEFCQYLEKDNYMLIHQIHIFLYFMQYMILMFWIAKHIKIKITNT